MKISKAHVARMVEQVDRDGSGVIEFPEFVELMTTSLGLEHDEHEAGAVQTYQDKQRRMRRLSQQQAMQQQTMGNKAMAAAAWGGGKAAISQSEVNAMQAMEDESRQVKRKDSVPLPFSLLVLAHHRRKIIEAVTVNNGGSRQKLVDRHDERKRTTAAEKRSQEKALRKRVKQKKNAPKFLAGVGKARPEDLMAEREEQEMAMKMKREVRRRSMAYADGVGADELDEHGFPISFRKGVSVEDFLMSAQSNRAKTAGADNDGAGNGNGDGDGDPDDLGYASNGNRIFLSPGGCPSVSMEAVMQRAHTAQSHQQFMGDRVMCARYELARRLDIDLPEDRAWAEAEAARVGDRAHRIGHRRDLQLREQMSKLTTEEDAEELEGEGAEGDDELGTDEVGAGGFRRRWGTDLLLEESSAMTSQQSSGLSRRDSRQSDVFGELETLPEAIPPRPSWFEATEDRTGGDVLGDAPSAPRRGVSSRGGEPSASGYLRPMTSHSPTRELSRAARRSHAHEPKDFGFGAVGRSAYEYDKDGRAFEEHVMANDGSDVGDDHSRAVIHELGIDASVASRLATAPNAMQLTTKELNRVQISERYRWDKRTVTMARQRSGAQVEPRSGICNGIIHRRSNHGGNVPVGFSSRSPRRVRTAAPAASVSRDRLDLPSVTGAAEAGPRGVDRRRARPSTTGPRGVGAAARAAALSEAAGGLAGVERFTGDNEHATGAALKGDRERSRARDQLQRLRRHPTGVAMSAKLDAFRGVREHRVRMLGSTAAAQSGSGVRPWLDAGSFGGVPRGPLDMLNPAGNEAALLVELGLPDPHFAGSGR